jgi:hypothetical protein
LKPFPPNDVNSQSASPGRDRDEEKIDDSIHKRYADHCRKSNGIIKPVFSLADHGKSRFIVGYVGGHVCYGRYSSIPISLNDFEMGANRYSPLSRVCGRRIYTIPLREDADGQVESDLHLRAFAAFLDRVYWSDITGIVDRRLTCLAGCPDGYARKEDHQSTGRDPIYHAILDIGSSLVGFI